MDRLPLLLRNALICGSLTLAVSFFAGVVATLYLVYFSTPPIDPQDQDGKVPHKALTDEHKQGGRL